MFQAFYRDFKIGRGNFAGWRKLENFKNIWLPVENPPVRILSENIEWPNRLRGDLEPELKDQQDRQAIGGLRNAASSVSRLRTVQAFGTRLGQALKAV